MLCAYAEGLDLHTLTAQSLTGRRDGGKNDRKLAKAVNFGLLYGMGAKGLQSYALRSYGVKMSLEEAALYRRRYFGAYAGLKRCREREPRALGNVADAETRTLSGRRPMDIEKRTDRLDAPLQGSGADGLELTLASLWERRAERLGAVPILVCHDEVAVEYGAEQAADVEGWLEKTMIDGMDAIMTGPNEVLMLAEVEARVSTGWGGGD